MKRPTAQTAQPLSLDERKASVKAIAATAPEKVREGIELIGFRQPTERERAHAQTLIPAARRALARRKAAA